MARFPPAVGAPLQFANNELDGIFRLSFLSFRWSEDDFATTECPFEFGDWFTVEVEVFGEHRSS